MAKIKENHLKTYISHVEYLPAMYSILCSLDIAFGAHGFKYLSRMLTLNNVLSGEFIVGVMWIIFGIFCLVCPAWMIIRKDIKGNEVFILMSLASFVLTIGVIIRSIYLKNS